MSRKKSVESLVIPENILAGHPNEIRTTAEMLRMIIKEAAPDAIEKAQPSWHSINYTHPTMGYFCAIFPFDGHVRLAFEWGVLLDDPQGTLEGDGRQVRYIVIRTPVEIREEIIRPLIEAALALPPSRDERLWMLRSKSNK